MPLHDTRATGGRPRRAFLGKLFDVTNNMKEGEGLSGKSLLGVESQTEASPAPGLGQTLKGCWAACCQARRRGGSAGSASWSVGVRAQASQGGGTDSEERTEALKWNKARERNGRRLAGNGKQAQRTPRWSKALKSREGRESAWKGRLSKDGTEGSGGGRHDGKRATNLVRHRRTLRRESVSDRGKLPRRGRLWWV